MSANNFFSYLKKTAFVFMLFCRHVVRLLYESFETSQESLVSSYYSAIEKLQVLSFQGWIKDCLKRDGSFVAKIGGT